MRYLMRIEMIAQIECQDEDTLKFLKDKLKEGKFIKDDYFIYQNNVQYKNEDFVCNLMRRAFIRI